MAKSKEELISMIENDLVDPSTNKITGERVKNALTEMVDAMGTGGGGNMEYLAVPEDKIGSGLVDSVLQYAYLAKGSMKGDTFVLPAAMFGVLSADVTAFALDLSTELSISGEAVTLGEFLEIDSSSLQEEGLIQITKEEFYTTL